jgi:16S rRNA (cytosine1402-N4)-methyltransferase
VPVCHTGGRGFKSRQPRPYAARSFDVAAPLGVPAGPSSLGPVTGYHTAVLAGTVARLGQGRRRVVDGTVGGGGHAAAFLQAGAVVLGIDRDPEALVEAKRRLGTDAVQLLRGSFGDPDVVATIAAFHPDFILLDLGVSSHQFDTDARGFSFRPDVPLDMRMSADGPAAADLLNTWSEAELATLLRDFGDEPRARRLAATIVERRRRRPLVMSDDLVGAIRRALGPRTGPGDFARLFQAVRIAVNDEISILVRALPALRDTLADGGLLVVIAYHSGEDRVVKQAFREWARTCRCPPRQPVCTCEGRAYGRVVTRRPIVADAEEIAGNARARSARLRAFEVVHGA